MGEGLTESILSRSRQLRGTGELTARGVIQSLEGLVVPVPMLRLLFCSVTNPPKEKYQSRSRVPV